MTLTSIALLCATLSAAPIKVATTTFTTVGDQAPSMAEFYGDHFALKLGEQPGFQVTTPKALAAVLGLERQKALMGCSEAATTCLTEFANALGVDALILGEAAKLETTTLLNIRIVAARDGATIATVSKRAATADALLDAIELGAQEAAAKLRQHFGRPAVDAAAVTPTPAAGAPVRWMPWAVAGTGAVAAGVGGFFLAQAADTYGALQGSPDKTFTPADASSAADDGRRQQTTGLALVGVGAAAVVGGVLWYALGAESSGPTVWVTPTGGMVGWAGALP